MKVDFDGFTAHLKLRNCREITITEHLKRMRQMESLEAFTFLDVKKYLDGLKLSGYSNMTLRNYVSTVRIYGEFLNVEELMKFPLKLFPRTKGIIRRTLPDETIEAFLSVPRRSNYLPEERFIMFNVFWTLLAYLALRPGECARLTKSMIDLPNKQIILPPEITKTHEPSTLPLYPNIYPLIEEYVKNLSGEYLFPSRHGGKYNDKRLPVMDSQDWENDFNARLAQIGVEKTPDLVPYSLRHSCATRWISAGMSYYKVRRLMRHAKLEQTLVYEHMTSKHLIADVTKHDPLVRKHAQGSDKLHIIEENLEEFSIDSDKDFSEEFKKGLKDLFYEEEKRLRAT